METEVVVVGHFFPLGIVERQRGLKPAGHGVGQVGDQLPGTDGDDHLLPLAGLEPIAVHVGRDEPVGRLGLQPALLLGHDLTVDRDGQRNLLAAPKGLPLGSWPPCDPRLYFGRVPLEGSALPCMAFRRIREVDQRTRRADWTSPAMPPTAVRAGRAQRRPPR